MAIVNPPVQKVPESILTLSKNLSPDVRKVFEELLKYLQEYQMFHYQLWKRTGGGFDLIANQGIRELYPWDLYSQEQEQDLKLAFAGIDTEENKQDLTRLFNYPQQQDNDILLNYISNLSTAIQSTDLPIVSITANYTTTESAIIICNNTTPITLTLNTNPVDQEKLIIVRRGGEVKVSGSINGESYKLIANKYDSPTLIYINDNSEWCVI